MKVYEITIKPSLNGFGTPLKGDTIFGHFCWQVAYDRTLLGRSLEELLAVYQVRPFAVFSSAFPKYCEGTRYLYLFKKPPLPFEKVFTLPASREEAFQKKKEYKAKKWMLFKEGERLPPFREMGDRLMNEKELLGRIRKLLSPEGARLLKERKNLTIFKKALHPHNTINRLTGTTGEGEFAPFGVDEEFILPDTELALFVGIDEGLVSIEGIRKGLERIGETGFGRDQSTGLGRFELGEDTEVSLLEMGSEEPDGCYTLSPCVPEKGAYKDMFFATFVRFGRHGDILARSSNPFKNPVIMADEGAVFIPKDRSIFQKPYIGRAITGLSKAEPNTVTQGYSLYIPVRLEG